MRRLGIAHNYCLLANKHEIVIILDLRRLAVGLAYVSYMFVKYSFVVLQCGLFYLHDRRDNSCSISIHI